MKSFAFVAAAIAVLSASTASGAKCVLSELVAELDPITAMVYACAKDTGYAVIPPRANPTAEQTAAVCTKCAEMIAMAKTMTFNTCTFAVAGVDIPLNEWVPKITGACAATSAGSAASTTSSVGGTANATTTSPAAANATSSTTTSTSAPTKSSGSGSSGASKSTVTAPTPAPTGSAGVVASLSVATTVVAVGSIAALLL